ncbi:unnamed protein product [Leptidea sinapis]|uniref:Uncharacterized protein n=1 Tax=Leptidea sinapis TaxID=189913 RepID=A0A5E4QS09_9NEOP|nr:unnamed protein product [Leptidea sinapis]
MEFEQLKYYVVDFLNFKRCGEVSRTCNSIASFEQYGRAYVKINHPKSVGSETQMRLEPLGKIH